MNDNVLYDVFNSFDDFSEFGNFDDFEILEIFNQTKKILDDINIPL